MSKKEKLLDFEFEWEGLTECPLCSNSVMIPNGSVDWLKMQFWYVVCPKCGLKYMNPRPTQGSYQEFYKNLFWEQKVRNLGFIKHGQMWGIKQYKWDNQKKKWNAKEGRKNKMEKLKALRVETITKALKEKIKLNENTEILEVGCGFPVTLNALHKNYKCKTYAIEPSAEAQDEIKKYKHIKFLAPYGEALEKIGKKQKFNVVIFSHSLENTSVPFDIMKYAKESLKKGGVIYVQCSNLQTFDQMNPYHPYIFSESAFRYLAKKLKMKYERLSKETDRMLTSLFIK